MSPTEQLRCAEGRRYRSFEEFSNHFYAAADSPKHDPNDEHASFGLQLSRDLLRENLRASPRKSKQAHPESTS
jgi:hypothetical protein